MLLPCTPALPFTLWRRGRGWGGLKNAEIALSLCSKNRLISRMKGKCKPTLRATGKVPLTNFTFALVRLLAEASLPLVFFDFVVFGWFSLSVPEKFWTFLEHHHWVKLTWVKSPSELSYFKHLQFNLSQENSIVIMSQDTFKLSWVRTGCVKPTDTLCIQPAKIHVYWSWSPKPRERRRLTVEGQGFPSCIETLHSFTQFGRLLLPYWLRL